MHIVLEKARKSAGISGMTKNYPDNPRQRGCGYWAAYNGSVGNDLAATDEKILALQKKVAELSNRIADLEKEKNAEFVKRACNGVEAIAASRGWSEEERRLATTKIAG